MNIVIILCVCAAVPLAYQPPDPLTENDFTVILVELESLKDWKSFGLELRVPARKLDHIQHKFPVESLEQVILHWIAAEGNNCTWNYLVAALKKIGETGTASRISRKYISKDFSLGMSIFFCRIRDLAKEGRGGGILFDLKTTPPPLFNFFLARTLRISFHSLPFPSFPLFPFIFFSWTFVCSQRRRRVE